MRGNELTVNNKNEYCYAIVEQGSHEDYQVNICRVIIKEKDKFLEFCKLQYDIKIVAWTNDIEIVINNNWSWGITTPQKYQQNVLKELELYDLTKTFIIGSNVCYPRKKGTSGLIKNFGDSMIKSTQIQFNK